MAERSKPLSPEERAEQSGWMERIKARGADGEAALAEVFAKYEARTVRRLQARFALDEYEAEDCWQEAVFDLWTHADRFRTGADLAPWLNTLACNRALKLLDEAWRRHRKPLREDDSAAATDETEHGGSSADASPAQATQAQTAAMAEEAPVACDLRAVSADACVDDGLARFEQKHPREARWLIGRDFEDRDVPAIAAEMGCDVVNARQRLRKIRLSLAPFLQHCRDLLPLR